jgi:CBS domain containing-hemolysin-like protein
MKCRKKDIAVSKSSKIILRVLEVVHVLKELELSTLYPISLFLKIKFFRRIFSNIPRAKEHSTFTNLDDTSRNNCEKENKQKEGIFSKEDLTISNSILKLGKAFSRSIIRFNFLLDSIFFNE